MNTDHTTRNPSPGWQILGEMELPAGAGMLETLNAWLTERLRRLHLQQDLQNKIIASAQDAAVRATATVSLPHNEHIHITIFVPARQEENEQAWGFFRIEKVEPAGGKRTGAYHAVEFYLYGEGD